jgi:hypothetical protein
MGDIVFYLYMDMKCNKTGGLGWEGVLLLVVASDRINSLSFLLAVGGTILPGFVLCLSLSRSLSLSLVFSLSVLLILFVDMSLHAHKTLA